MLAESEEEVTMFVTIIEGVLVGSRGQGQIPTRKCCHRERWEQGQPWKCQRGYQFPKEWSRLTRIFGKSARTRGRGEGESSSPGLSVVCGEEYW